MRSVEMRGQSDGLESTRTAFAGLDGSSVLSTSCCKALRSLVVETVPSRTASPLVIYLTSTFRKRVSAAIMGRSKSTVRPARARRCRPDIAKTNQTAAAARNTTQKTLCFVLKSCMPICPCKSVNCSNLVPLWDGRQAICAIDREAFHFRVAYALESVWLRRLVRQKEVSAAPHSGLLYFSVFVSLA
jgi:hypothetical protein